MAPDLRAVACELVEMLEAGEIDAPDPKFPQQIHLDLHFEDQPAAAERALRLGAICLPQRGSCATYADPAGHPFCLRFPGQ